MKTDKRGQLFTILTILLLALMFITLEIYSVFHEREAIKTRVSTMDSFLHSIEKNLERQLYISGFRAVLLAGDEVTFRVGYIPNITEFFEEAFYNGTVNGVPSNLTVGATYDDMLNSINNNARKINVEIIMENTTVKFEHDGPWNIRFTMISDFVMQDKQGLAKWEKKQNISVLLPVEGFEDPFFTVNSGAKISRKINRTIYEGNYVSVGDYSNLSDHFDKEYYAAHSDAPSFLMRLEGNMDPSPNGIESFVKLSDFENQQITVDYTKSVVDHEYFDPGGASGDLHVPEVNSKFRIDSAGHKTKYQIP
jgi:hypothetical protein